MDTIDIAVIGGGCAGLAAGLAAHEHGAERVVIFERSPYTGGVLQQCVHNGFGIHRFGEDLTGTQYAARFIRDIDGTNIVCKTDTTVLGVSRDRVITTVSHRDGWMAVRARAVVLATGCRERPRGALLIPGSRPAGVLTAGTAQHYINIEGYLVGKRIVILGSGDIGLIMARQFVLEGAEVVAVVEMMPYSGGLMRNVVQCIEDFGIPLHYSTTVTRIIGEKRVEGVWLAPVGQRGQPDYTAERFVECDTLVLSVGLIPENELAFDMGIDISPETGGPAVDDWLQTSVEGVFACGNALHVHDLADFVTEESARAGVNAACYATGRYDFGEQVSVEAGPGVRGIVPQRLRLCGDDIICLQFRPTGRFHDRHIAVYSGGVRIAQKRCRILVPGEMCEIRMKRADITGPVQVRLEV